MPISPPRLVANCAAVLMVTGLPAPTSWADGPVLGGGAGITVNGTPCTLATIGNDNTGELVGFTAAHCGGPGSQVAAEGGGSVGTVTAANGDLDYAVIKFDPAKVTPVANFAGFAISGIGPDPSYGLPFCTHGAASGDGCGRILVQSLTPGVTGAGGLPSWRPGDDGEPVTVDGQLVGMTRNGMTMNGFPEPRMITHIAFALFSAIMNDTNAKGGPGAGFSTIPA